MVKNIVWPEIVQKQLQQAYNYIRQSSPQNAEKIKKDIFNSTRDLLMNPERHPPDKYRINNDGTFRAYEHHRFRISYKISKEEIIMVGVRHKNEASALLKPVQLKKISRLSLV